MEVPELVEVVDGETLQLTGSDGSSNRLAAAMLRRSCSCADCLAERDRRTLRLTVVGAEPTIEGARLVGDYGISLVFGPDGHRTGIFRWDHLAKLAARGVTDSADRSDTST